MPPATLEGVEALLVNWMPYTVELVEVFSIVQPANEPGSDDLPATLARFQDIVTFIAVAKVKVAMPLEYAKIVDPVSPDVVPVNE
jgi:hypothetical protein